LIKANGGTPLHAISGQALELVTARVFFLSVRIESPYRKEKGID
jgi:hypothetical protein